MVERISVKKIIKERRELDFAKAIENFICHRQEKIVKFYQDNGFAYIQNSDDNKYLQMIRFL